TATSGTRSCTAANPTRGTASIGGEESEVIRYWSNSANGRRGWVTTSRLRRHLWTSASESAVRVRRKKKKRNKGSNSNGICLSSTASARLSHGEIGQFQGHPAPTFDSQNPHQAQPHRERDSTARTCAQVSKSSLVAVRKFPDTLSAQHLNR